jgi:cytochrome b-561
MYEWLDQRLDLDGDADVLGKAFPAEDSFLLGEVAIFCFFVLALTGVFLGFFFEPSTSEVTYEGSVAKFQGQDLPEAYVSVLHITYDVPFGMLLRRMHHWAAHLFVASLGLHMLRVFFTGAYRNPREINWVVGSGLAVLAMFAAYTGYALPFDEFASTATGIGYNIALSIPIIGEGVAKLVFGGSFPSSATVPRLYFMHVLLIPLAITGLLAVHMGILLRQKHTEAPRDGDLTGPQAVDEADDSVVVGLPAVPNQAAVSAVVFFLTLAVLSILAGFLPVHNVAAYGPNDPAGTPGLIMPDWFLMWLYGFLKLLPSWLSFTVPVVGIHVNTEFVGGIVLPGIVFALVFAWPFIDYESDAGHFTRDPYDRPWQTTVGVAAVVFIMIASIAGMNNILAEILGVSTALVNPLLTAWLVFGPIVAAAITYETLTPHDEGVLAAAGMDVPEEGILAGTLGESLLDDGEDDDEFATDDDAADDWTWGGDGTDGDDDDTGVTDETDEMSVSGEADEGNVTDETSDGDAAGDVFESAANPFVTKRDEAAESTDEADVTETDGVDAEEPTESDADDDEQGGDDSAADDHGEDDESVFGLSSGPDAADSDDDDDVDDDDDGWVWSAEDEDPTAVNDSPGTDLDDVEKEFAPWPSERDDDPSTTVDWDEVASDVDPDAEGEDGGDDSSTTVDWDEVTADIDDATDEDEEADDDAN